MKNHSHSFFGGENSPAAVTKVGSFLKECNKEPVSPIVCSAPKSFSRQFVFHRKCVSLSQKFVIRVPSKPLIAFLSQTLFYSQT